MKPVRLPRPRPHGTVRVVGLLGLSLALRGCQQPGSITPLPEVPTGEITGFTGTVSWAESIDEAAVCEGTSEVSGTRSHDFCEGCTFHFLVTAVPQSPLPDGCSPAALNTWVGDDTLEVTALEYWPYAEQPLFGYDEGHIEEWALEYN